MRQINFKKIKGIDGIGNYFYTSVDFIEKIIDSIDQNDFYEKLEIVKKNCKSSKKYRIVYKSVDELSQLQKNIAEAIDVKVEFPTCVQGFIKGRSPKSNAEQHLNRKYLLSADVSDFFDSIGINQVFEVFIKLGCDSNTAKILAKICTINGTLAQGLHSSPVISNLIVTEMDNEIMYLCSAYGAVYTRYADDISISSNKNLPTKDSLIKILENNSFKLNEEKFRIAKQGQGQFVTGLSVFDPKYPRIPKRIKRQLRLELYYINKYGMIEHLERLGIPDFAHTYRYNRIRGHIDYVNATEPILAKKFYSMLPYQINQNIKRRSR